MSTVTEGSILDFDVEECKDSDGNTRCTAPFLVTKSTCYRIEWSTQRVIAHTTAEVRDAGSDELVYYRDTDGEWTPEKGEVSDFTWIRFLFFRDFRSPLGSLSTWTSSPRSRARGMLRWNTRWPLASSGGAVFCFISAVVMHFKIPCTAGIFTELIVL